MSKSTQRAQHKRRKQQHRPFWQRPESLITGGIVVAGVILLVLMGGGGSMGSSTPAFTANTLDGETVALDDFRGQVVMLNFWATWCPPCRAEMPDIQAVYNRRSGEGFSVLAVNNAESPAQITPFVTSLGLRFPVILDQDARLQRQFAINSYPTSIFLDATGTIYATHSGMVSAAQLEAYIDQGLARGNGA